MKITLKYTCDDNETLSMSMKLTLPQSWISGPASKLKTTFVDNYNKKHAGNELTVADIYLQSPTDNNEIKDADVIEQRLAGANEVLVKKGKFVFPSVTTDGGSNGTSAITATATTSPAADLKTCKRFGCGKKFTPGAESDSNCKHHKKPPVFHETRKYWACCPDKIAWDWEEFQQIPGCTTEERHTDVVEDKNKPRFMGGTELRAETQSTPQPIVKLTSLDKLSNLRKWLVELGVDGQAFDAVRDKIKIEKEKEHPDAGVKIWDLVCTAMSEIFSETLKKKTGY